MTPNEAEDIMKPFFPNDPNLARKALSRVLNEGMIPEWIVNYMVKEYFTFLALNKLHEFVQQHDPFGWDTIPYLDNLYKENKN